MAGVSFTGPSMGNTVKVYKIKLCNVKHFPEIQAYDRSAKNFQAFTHNLDPMLLLLRLPR